MFVKRIHIRSKKIMAKSLIMGLLTAVIFVPITESQASKNDLMIEKELTRIKVPFVPNRGQTDSSVAYYAPTFAGTLYVTHKGKLVYSLPAGPNEKVHKEVSDHSLSITGWTLTETMVGGKINIKAGKCAKSKINYFIGNNPKKWQKQLPTYETLNLGEIWPRIQVSLKAHGSTIEKLFYLEPGADVSKIRIHIEGATALAVGEDGILSASTGLGDVAFSYPVAWQMKEDERISVAVAYSLKDKDYGFVLGDHDPRLPVFIDPVIQATYLGGSEAEYSFAIDTHPIGEEIFVYVAGFTKSGTGSTIEFPNNSGAQTDYGGGDQDAFVARLNSDFTMLQATYLGGSDDDEARDITVQNISGLITVFVTGFTSSNDFPAVGRGGGIDAFVAKLNNNLSTLEARYFGGSGTDRAVGIAFRDETPLPAGVYIVGDTDSHDLSGTTDRAQESLSGYDDAFVAFFQADTLNYYATYFSGGYNGNEAANAVDCLCDGTDCEVYIAGNMLYNFPNYPQYINVMVARLNGSLTSVGPINNFGGEGMDIASAIAVNDTTGDIYVAGRTYSDPFPVTAGSAYTTQDGYGGEAFVARLDHSLNITEATYLGGSGPDHALDLAIDPSTNSLYVFGSTSSMDFRGLEDGLQPVRGGVFIVSLNDSLSDHEKGTYLGSSYDECLGHGLSLAEDAGQMYVYITGNAGSDDFPGITDTVYQPSRHGSIDAFIARLDASLAPSTLEPEIEIQPRDHDFGNVESSSDPLTITIENWGETSLILNSIDFEPPSSSDFSLVTSGTGMCEDLNFSVPPGERCDVTVTFSPTTLYRQSTTLLITSNDTDETESRVSLTGTHEPDINIIPPFLYCGEVIYGMDATWSFHIYNEGVADLQVNNIFLPDMEEYFSMYSGECGLGLPFIIPNGQNCQVHVNFSPTDDEPPIDDENSYTSEVTIQSNDPDEGEVTIPLSGTGIKPPDERIAIEPEGPVYYFGDVAVGNSSSVWKEISITNVGTDDVQFNSELDNWSNFSLDLYGVDSYGCTEGQFLTPGNSCNIYVRFSPTQLGVLMGTLTIKSGATGVVLAEIELRGLGLPDEDSDGISDEEEKGPEGTAEPLDTDGDGTPDYMEADTASLRSASSRYYYVTLSTSNGTLSGVKAIYDTSIPHGCDTSLVFPLGLFEFTVTGLEVGGATDVTFKYHGNEDPFSGETPRYYKYGPEPPTDYSQHCWWFSYDGDTNTGLRIWNPENNSFTIRAIDGGRGDSDLSLNGEILDPGGPGSAPADTDGDGVLDNEDNCPDTSNPDQTDNDGDEVGDACDGCSGDPGKSAPGICGCGTPDTDTDGDGTPDCHDNCPDDPDKTEPEVCDCGNADIDSDGDGALDCLDNCPDDPNKTEPGDCGCGIPDIDSDGDGILDCVTGSDPYDGTGGRLVDGGGCGCATFAQDPNFSQFAMTGLLYLIPFGYAWMMSKRMRRKPMTQRPLQN